MHEQYAVLDLGSNSFRLLLARQQGELVQIVERVKEKVQLVRGFRDGRIDPAAIDRALACLGRYAQRLRGLARDRIAMVGTHALREGTNRHELVGAAEAVMGVPLRILSGEEEATLIYRGVQLREPPPPSVGRFVMDIGGGSTELAWGGAGAAAGALSCSQGCVSLADRFFQREVPLGTAFDAARAHLQQTLPRFEPVSAGVEVIGTSGTIESVQAVLSANGWSDGVITAEGLAGLAGALRDGRWDTDTGMLGVAPERIDTFPAGVALLEALFDRLRIRSMRYAAAALEDGVMYGMLDGFGDAADVRRTTIRGLQARYGIDARQAQRVRDTATALFDGTAAWWASGSAPAESAASATTAEPVTSEPLWRELLECGAALHELGLVVSPRAYHRHGAYLLKHADLRGFSGLEREYLALLVRGHRRGLPMLAFSAVPARDQRPLVRLVALLRIAVILERSHADGESPRILVQAGVLRDGDHLVLTLPAGWRERHPLSMRELEIEPGQLAGAGIRLELAGA